MKNMIEVTGIDLRVFVKKVYDLSVPQGLGFLHYQKDSLTDGELEEVLAHSNDNTAIDMDYVKGRACKMVVFKENGKLFIPDRWYDHTTSQLKELLKDFSISTFSKEHNIACNCKDCKAKRN